MEDSTKLKISRTIKSPKQVKTIISFKNESDENIIAVGLIGCKECEDEDSNNNNESEKNYQIIFYNIFSNKEWGFNLYPKITTIDHLVFYLEDQINYFIASRCSNDQNLLVFNYKTGKIFRQITVPRVDCLLFKSFKYRGIRRFAYDINKQDLNIIDFETSGIIVPISYQEFTPVEAKKIRFISNRLIIVLAGKKTNGHFVIRFLDIDSRQIILEHGFENSPKELFYHLTPLRNITKFSKVILNFDNEEIECGMLCLKYNIDGTIVNEKFGYDLIKKKKQRMLMKWSDNNYELIDLVEDNITVIDFNSWKCKYTFQLGKSPVKLEKIKINNIFYLTVLYEDGNVNLYALKS